MDKKDRAILNELRNNSRQSWREIGEKVFLSSQAVGQRVQELLNNHSIQRFTIKEQRNQLQFITIYMNTNLKLFLNKIENFARYKVSHQLQQIL